MMRKRKIIGIIGLVLILVIVLFYVVRIRPMVKEYKNHGNLSQRHLLHAPLEKSNIISAAFVERQKM